MAVRVGSIKMRSLKYTVQNVVDDDEAPAKVPQVAYATTLLTPFGALMIPLLRMLLFCVLDVAISAYQVHPIR